MCEETSGRSKGIFPNFSPSVEDYQRKNSQDQPCPLGRFRFRLEQEGEGESLREGEDTGYH